MAPLNKPGEQVRRLREIVKTYPHNRNCRVSLALALATQGDLDAASLLREQILDCNPRDHAVRGVDAMYAALSGEFEAARSAAAQAPDLAGSLYAHFALFMLHENWDETQPATNSTSTASVRPSCMAFRRPSDLFLVRKMLISSGSCRAMASSNHGESGDGRHRHTPAGIEDACAMHTSPAVPDRATFRTERVPVEMQDAEGRFPYQIRCACGTRLLFAPLTAIEDRDVEQIKAAYEAHPENFPSPDYAGLSVSIRRRASDEWQVQNDRGALRTSWCKACDARLRSLKPGRLEETRGS